MVEEAPCSTASRRTTPGASTSGSQELIVEASSVEEAEARAVAAGVYFDGVAAERDCECCGDRWFRDPDAFASREEAIASVLDSRQPENDSPVYQVVERA